MYQKIKKQVLVIDDDVDLCQIIKKYLDRDGYIVDIVNTGCSGIKMIEKNEYHLIILDIMLPEMDGFSVLSIIRSKSNVPVLMLTAMDGESDKIKGLKNGADDYMTKPFSINELMARTESLIRRYTALGQKDEFYDVLHLKTIEMNVGTRSVLINNIPVELTVKEFDLLYFLASHKGMVFTKKQIFNQVWEEDYMFDDSNIMSFISKLRKKIEPDVSNPTYIQTIRGVGYRFNQEA